MIDNAVLYVVHPPGGESDVPPGHNWRTDPRVVALDIRNLDIIHDPDAGPPLTHPDFVDLVPYAARRPIILSTSRSLLPIFGTERWLIQSLGRWRQNGARILSLDGFDLQSVTAAVFLALLPGVMVSPCAPMHRRRVGWAIPPLPSEVDVVVTAFRQTRSLARTSEYLADHGITTRGGAHYYPVTVRRLLLRALGKPVYEMILYEGA